MLSIESLILITGILLLLGIASNKLSARMGVPVLFLFLAVGILAGSEGIGGIEFEDYALANSIGTIALCLVLFDGHSNILNRSVRGDFAKVENDLVERYGGIPILFQCVAHLKTRPDSVAVG